MKRLWILGIALATAVRACAAPTTITVKGSDTLVILAQKWAEVYMGSHPEVRIQVTGGGSGIGFAALQNGQTDLADASRPIKPKEIEGCIRAFGRRPVEYKVALDGLSIYVHKENALTSISLEELAAIFTGQVNNWKELGGPDLPITVYSRENSSGTYEFFKEHVLKGKDFTSTAQTMPGTAAVLQAVTKDPGGIGYGGAAYGAGAKALRVSRLKGEPGIEANEKNVLDGSYPISRYLFVYVNPALDKGAIHAYLSWVRGEEGQKRVKEIGYYPLPEPLRAKP